MTKYILITFLFFTSCSSLPSLDYLELAESSARYVTGRNDIEITNEIYQLEEYSFIKVRIGRSSPVIMVLAYINDGIFEWVGSDYSRIYTYNGKIIELNGFKNDIKIQHPQSKIFNLSSSSGNNYAVDFYNPQLLSLNVNGENSQEMNDKHLLKRLDNEEKFLEIVEITNAPLIKWKAKNYYYFDSSGTIFKTIQDVHPRMPPIDIEFYIK